MKRMLARYVLAVFSALILITSLVSASINYWFNSKITTVLLEDPTTLTPATSPLPRTFPTPPASPPPTTLSTSPQGIQETILPNPVEIPQSTQYAEHNILLIGSDKRSNPDSPITGERSDTTILIHIPADRSHATALSIPRDLWVTIPECKKGDTTLSEKQGKFNESFARAGASCTIKTVTNLTGVPINNVVVVDFQGFRKIVNAIGGLEICLRNPVKDTKSGLDLPAGKQNINGKEALALARARYNLSDGSDLARITRQQKIIDEIAQQTLERADLKDPQGIYELAVAVLDMVSVDESLNTLPTLMPFLSSLMQIPPASISYDTVPHLPYTGGNLLPDERELEKIINENFVESTFNSFNSKTEKNNKNEGIKIKEDKSKPQKKDSICPEGYIY